LECIRLLYFQRLIRVTIEIDNITCFT